MEQRGAHLSKARVAGASSEAGGATRAASQHRFGRGIQTAVLCPRVEMNGSLFLVSRGYNTQYAFGVKSCLL